MSDHTITMVNSMQLLQQRVKQILASVENDIDIDIDIGTHSLNSSRVSPSVNSCTPSGHPLRWWLRSPGYRRAGADYPIDGGHNLFQPGWQWVNHHGIVLTRDIVTGPSQQLEVIDSCLDLSIAQATAATRAHPELLRALHVRAHPPSETAGNGFASIQPWSASWDHLKALLQEESVSSDTSSSSSSHHVGASSEEFPPSVSEISAAVDSWSESQLEDFLTAHDRLASLAAAFEDEDVASLLPINWADDMGRSAMGQSPLPIQHWYGNQMQEENQPANAITAGEQVNHSLRGATKPIFFLLPWGSSYDRRLSLGSGHPPGHPTSSVEEMVWPQMDQAQRDAMLEACIEPALLSQHASKLIKSAPFFTASAESYSASSSTPFDAEAMLDQPSAWMAQLSSLVRECPWPLISTSSAMSPYAARISSEAVCVANHIGAQLKLLDLEAEAEPDPVGVNDSMDGVKQATIVKAHHSLVPPDGSIARVDLHLFWTACATSSSPIESNESESRSQIEALRLAQQREANSYGHHQPTNDMNLAWSHRFASRRYLLSQSSPTSESSPPIGAIPIDIDIDIDIDIHPSHPPLSHATTRLLCDTFPFPIEIHLSRHYSPAPVVIASPIVRGWVACILVGADDTTTQ